MTTKELTERLSNLEDILLKLTEKKPSWLRQIWNWIKPSLVPFILGMIVGGLVSPIPFSSQPAHEHQAALGGAAIPFQSGNPSPRLSSLPPSDSKAEGSDSLLTNISEPPLQANPQAVDGQTTSTRFYWLPLRRMR
jgi:hypothetical protein